VAVGWTVCSQCVSAGSGAEQQADEDGRGNQMDRASWQCRRVWRQESTARDTTLTANGAYSDGLESMDRGRRYSNQRRES
jgi:hypothetical protein